VYSDNYLDGGYHIPHLHSGLNSELDMATYDTKLFDTASVQTCVSRSDRVGKVATYLYLFPNIAVNKCDPTFASSFDLILLHCKVRIVDGH